MKTWRNLHFQFKINCMCPGISRTKILIYPYIVTLYEPFSKLMTSNKIIVLDEGDVEENVSSGWSLTVNHICSFICSMTTSSNGDIFRVTGLLYGEFTCSRWIPLTKASDEDCWCFLLSVIETNSWENNRDTSDLRRHRTHYDVKLYTTLFLSKALSSLLNSGYYSCQ